MALFTRKDGAFNYFKAFIDLSDYSLKAANLLVDTLSQFNRQKLDYKIRKMQDIEHAADLAKHSLINKLVKEFLPPIEREDILTLSEKIDDVTDTIESVLLNIGVFNVQSIPKELLKFSKVIFECCKSMRLALIEFENYRKSKKLDRIIIEINTKKETADRLYMNEMKKLYMFTANPIKLMIWKDLLQSMRKCCIACEDVANTIQIIVMKSL